MQVLLRCADREVLGAAAKSRNQSLSQFLAEVLVVAAAGLRRPVRPAITPLDVYSRRSDLVPEDDDSDICYTMPRPKRAPHLSAGPTPRNR